jgi:hypothetical protein
VTEYRPSGSLLLIYLCVNKKKKVWNHRDKPLRKPCNHLRPPLEDELWARRDTRAPIELRVVNGSGPLQAETRPASADNSIVCSFAATSAEWQHQTYKPEVWRSNYGWVTSCPDKRQALPPHVRTMSPDSTWLGQAYAIIFQHRPIRRSN